MGKKMKNTRHHKETPLKLLVVILMLALFSALSGCALTQQNFGTFKEDDKVTEAFETFQVMPDYKYYYSGPANYPTAILGIHRDYQLQSDLWKEAELTESRLKEWVDELNDSFRSFKYGYNGFAILDHTGKQVGIWYSMVGGVTVNIKPDNRIIVHTPDNSLIMNTSAPSPRVY